MKKLAKYLVVMLVLLMELAIIGCATIPNLVTPCWIEQEAIAAADIDVPNLLPYTTLKDAEKVASVLNFKHLKNQYTIARSMEDENINHDFLMNTHNLNMQASREFQKKVFSATGPLGILSAGLLGSLMLFIDKPGTKKRLDKAKETGRKEVNGAA